MYALPIYIHAYRCMHLCVTLNALFRVIYNGRTRGCVEYMDRAEVRELGLINGKIEGVDAVFS